MQQPPRALAALLLLALACGAAAAGGEAAVEAYSGTLKVYALKRRGSGEPQPLVQGRVEQAVVKTAEGLYVNIVNINDLKAQRRLPEGWGWDAQVTVTGRILRETSPVDTELEATGLLVRAPAPPNRLVQRLRQLRSTRHLLTEAKPGIKVASACPPLRTGATTTQSKTISLKLAAGDYPIKLEWMQASGTLQVQLMWRTGLALTYATPRFVPV